MPKVNPFAYAHRYLVLHFVDGMAEARLVTAARVMIRVGVRTVVNMRQLWQTQIDDDRRAPVDFLLQFVRELKSQGVDARLVRAGIVCVRKYLAKKRYPTSEVLYDQVADGGRHSPQASPAGNDAGRVGYEAAHHTADA